MSLLLAIMWVVISLVWVGRLISKIQGKAGKVFIAYDATVVCTMVVTSIFFFLNLNFYGFIFGVFVQGFLLLIGWLYRLNQNSCPGRLD